LDCFEFDWQCLKLPKMKISRDTDVKEELRKVYPKLREIYKRLAGLGIIGNIYAITLNIYTEFIKDDLGLIDGECLQL